MTLTSRTNEARITTDLTPPKWRGKFKAMESATERGKRSIQAPVQTSLAHRCRQHIDGAVILLYNSLNDHECAVNRLAALLIHGGQGLHGISPAFFFCVVLNWRIITPQ